MANKFQIKRTSTSGRTPNTTNSANSYYIDAGELAVNLPDGRLYTSNGSALIEVGANLTSLNVVGNTTVNGTFVAVNDTATINVLSATKITLTGNTSQTVESITNTVSAWQYNTSLSVAGQETEPRDIFFSNTGTKMFILGNVGDDITAYDLTEAWNVATSNTTSTATFSLATQGTTPVGMYFRDNGLTFYVIDSGADAVYRYDMTSAWDITTAVSNNSFSVAAQETAGSAVHFSSNGSIMYLLGTTGDDITWYDLSTPWDITTAVANSQFDVSVFETAAEGMFFSTDGTALWITGATFGRLVQYALSTPWNLNTATPTDISSIIHISDNDTTRYFNDGSSGIYVNPTVNKAWISEYNNDRVHEFVTNIPATRFVGSNLVVDKEINFKRSVRIQEGLEVARTAVFVNGVRGITSFSSPTFNPISSSSTFSLGTGTASGAFNLATALTTGLFTMGGTGQTGGMVIGRSTANATVNIHSGATVSTNIKTLNIGVAGVSGSFTNVNIGSTVSGATTNVNVTANTTQLLGNVVISQASTIGGSLLLFKSANTTGFEEIRFTDSGANSAFDFGYDVSNAKLSVERYNSNGVSQDTPISIFRSNGQIDIATLLNVSSSQLKIGSLFSSNSTILKITSNDVLMFNDGTTQNTAFRVYDESGTRIA